MKDTDIHIGTCYDITVGNNTTAVRIMKPLATGGWEAVTLASNKTIIIKSASRLVGVHRPTTPTTAQGAAKGTESSQDTTGHPAPTTAKPAQNTLRTNRMSILDAAAHILAEAKEPLNCKLMIQTMTDKDYWQPAQGGKTPANTLHAAIGSEIKKKGADSPFEKVGRGLFGLR